MRTYYEGHDALIIGLKEDEILCADVIVRECLARAKKMDWEQAECELFCFSDCALLMMRPAQPKCLRGSRHRSLRLKRR